MGIITNLRVLFGSDIGDQVREIRNKVVQLEGDLDEVRELSESRYRRLRKRQSDDRGSDNGDVAATPQSPELARILARRAARVGGSGNGA